MAMNKIKLYIYLAVFIFVLALIMYSNAQHKIIQRSREQIERLKDNIDNLLQENATLITINLQKEEVTGRIKKERDSLAAALKIKPRQVIQYIDRIIYQHDTVIKIVEVKKISDTSFYLTDADKCWKWEGLAIIENKELEVKRLLFDYHNEIFDLYYYKRKFPLIGKKIYFHQVRQQCGESYTKEVNFVKKR